MTATRLMLAIAATVLVWGVYHAVGAYLYNHNPWRPVMVLGCVGAFLGFWLLLLRSSRFRDRMSSQGEPPLLDD